MCTWLHLEDKIKLWGNLGKSEKPIDSFFNNSAIIGSISIKNSLYKNIVL